MRQRTRFGVGLHLEADSGFLVAPDRKGPGPGGSVAPPKILISERGRKWMADFRGGIPRSTLGGFRAEQPVALKHHLFVDRQLDVITEQMVDLLRSQAIR